jgi:hypothetical protein
MPYLRNHGLAVDLVLLHLGNDLLKDMHVYVSAFLLGARDLQSVEVRVFHVMGGMASGPCFGRHESTIARGE